MESPSELLLKTTEVSKVITNDNDEECDQIVHVCGQKMANACFLEFVKEGSTCHSFVSEKAMYKTNIDMIVPLFTCDWVQFDCTKCKSLSGHLNSKNGKFYFSGDRNSIQYSCGIEILLREVREQNLGCFTIHITKPTKFITEKLKKQTGSKLEIVSIVDKFQQETTPSKEEILQLRSKLYELFKKQSKGKILVDCAWK